MNEHEKLKPKQPLHFQGLEPSETIELFLRRHPIVLVQKFTFLFFVGILPVIAWIIITTQTSWLETQTLIRIPVILSSSAFYLFWLRFCYTVWLDYYLDVWVVTNERIMNIEQKGLFHRTISQQRLTKIQDVTTETKGYLQTFLHFGDIRVQTAGETGHFMFHDIDKPETVSQAISLLQQKAVAAEATELHEATKQHDAKSDQPQKPEKPQPTPTKAS